MKQIANTWPHNFPASNTVFLLYGFAKNERANITQAERAALLLAGDAYMKLTDAELDMAVEKKKLLELKAKKAT